VQEEDGLLTVGESARRLARALAGQLLSTTPPLGLFFDGPPLL
jgi:hypothetical protein